MNHGAAPRRACTMLDSNSFFFGGDLCSRLDDEQYPTAKCIYTFSQRDTRTSTHSSNIEFLSYLVDSMMISDGTRYNLLESRELAR